MNLDNLSRKQRQVVKHAVSPGTCMFAGGAVRSGKSYASSLGFALFVASKCKGFDAAICGSSIESVMRNVGFDLITTFESLGVTSVLNRTNGTRLILNPTRRKHGERFIKPTSVWVIGANDDRAKSRIQGCTLKALMVDETVLVPEDFWNMAYSRLSIEGAKLWGTYNPASPAHFFKKKVVDRLGEWDGKLIKFGLDDNPSLSEDYKARIRKAYTGHTYQRLVKGEWAGASGLIFPYWHSYNEPLKHGSFHVGLDWGVSGVLHALLIRQDNKSYSQVQDEFVYDAKEAGIPRTEDQHLQALSVWIKTRTKTATVWLDPNTPASFKRLLRDEGFQVRDANNKLVSGLVRTASMLETAQIEIGDCPSLIEEINGYLWDDTAEEDKPLSHQSDHGADALRYYAYTNFPTSANFKPVPLKKAFKNKRLLSMKG